MTIGIKNNLSPELVLFLWRLFFNLQDPIDEFQFFNLHGENGKQVIIHEQECLGYKKKYIIKLPCNIYNGKVYIEKGADFVNGKDEKDGFYDYWIMTLPEER